MFSTDLLQSIIKNIEKASKEKNLDCFCTTRDVFQARIDSFAIKSENWRVFRGSLKFLLISPPEGFS